MQDKIVKCRGKRDKQRVLKLSHAGRAMQTRLLWRMIRGRDEDGDLEEGRMLLQGWSSGMKREIYAPAAATAVLLRSGRTYRRDRMRAADMITIEAAASLAGVDSANIAAWIHSGCCIGIAGPSRKLKLPRWQFEPSVWTSIQRIRECLGATDGWQMLNFLETPTPALKGLTPRVALEQGIPIARVLAVAISESY
jgi:hypothetical protein